jgi:acyl-CoA synthetase (AMP-forming)/AMP-acid ligase II
MSDVQAIRGWLDAPGADTGVHLAADDGGWDFLPYTELAQQVRRIAGLLLDRGLGAGRTVAVLMPTSHLCLAAMFAVPAAGATLTPVAPPLFHDADRYLRHLRGLLDGAQADAVITTTAFAGVVAQATGTPAHIVLDDIPAATPLSELGEPGTDVLVQMTSGSTGRPRGARISWHNLAVNLDAIDAVCRLSARDATASWLPLYHDMGLIGTVFQAVSRQRGLYLMRPDQFIRDPGRWLRAAVATGHTVAPPFGLAYAGRRLTPADIDDLDLSGLRTIVVGAEPVDPDALRAFTELTAPRGFSPRAFLPSYGLAEATLIATAHRLGEPLRTVRIDKAALRYGKPVPVAEHGCSVVSVGVPIPGHRVRIEGAAADGDLGEIVLSGDSVFGGYRGDPDSTTRRIGDELHTGDAGFLLDGQLYVLGRMGTSLKVNGRTVFAEDLDIADRTTAVAVNDGGRPGVAIFVEQPCRTPISELRTALLARVGADTPVWFIGVPRGGLARTSSGKPRRAHMWQQWRSGQLAGAELLSAPAPGPLDKVRALFEKARELAVIPDDATVHFEGSLAEGFGNDGSDIDLLLLLPGTGAHAVMPTVLFIDGHRVEIRAQSHAQVRKRLHQVRRALDTGAHVTEDTLNRVQRFLRGTVLRTGPGYGDLRDIVTHPELTGLLARWWQRRADHCLRQSAALALLAGDTDTEAVAWAREGLTQSMKAFLARHGEGYLEVKWLPLQIDRLRRSGTADTLLDEYRRLDAAPTVAGVLALAARLGGPALTLDPRNVVLKKVPHVTTWPIRSATHVVRGRSDLFVLSAACAQSWRRVVFGQTLAQTTAAPQHLRLFARYGFIALQWRGAGTIKPAAAMCDPARPSTPPPSLRRPVLTIEGAPADGDIARSVLPPKAFAEAASALVLANMVLENAREDFDGAVKDGQWPVATLCGRRIVTMAVRILASAWGVTPLPGDQVLLSGLDTLVPEHPRLAADARRLADHVIGDQDEAARARADLDRLVTDVQTVTGGQMFPSSFASRAQWQETLRYGYQWLRMGGYLDAYVELDEARDLLASGGAQPSVRGRA